MVYHVIFVVVSYGDCSCSVSVSECLEQKDKGTELQMGSCIFLHPLKLKFIHCFIDLFFLFSLQFNLLLSHHDKERLSHVNPIVSWSSSCAKQPSTNALILQSNGFQNSKSQSSLSSILAASEVSPILLNHHPERIFHHYTFF